MSYEEEVLVLLAQMMLFKKRVYGLRQRVIDEARSVPPYHVTGKHKQASDELVHVLCALTSIQVRLGIAQYSFAAAKAD